MKANILVYDVGSTYTKGAAFALADGKLTFLARGQHPTTLENISDGARGAEAESRAKGGARAAPRADCAWSPWGTCPA